jgi:Stigma-specific protein, Stig1
LMDLRPSVAKGDEMVRILGGAKRWVQLTGLLLLAAAPLGCPRPPSPVDGGATSSGSTTGMTSTTGGTTTGGSTVDAGYALCAAEAIWVGNQCLLTNCTIATINEACVRPGGLVGYCNANACIDVSSDDQNCGGLGVSCPPGDRCAAGTCQGDGGTGCNQSCPTGTTCNPIYSGCVTTTCDGSVSGAGCWAGTTIGICCGGSCSDPKYDSLNCGGCGISCDGGSCDLGSCETTDCTTAPDNSGCSNTYFGFCCKGQCLVLDSDAQNCGGCGIACPSGQSCVNGFCTQGVCTKQPEGFGCEIAGDAGICCSGACIDYTSDTSCGDCGTSCPLGLHCSLYGCTNDAGHRTLCTKASDCAPGTGCLSGSGECLRDSCVGLADGLSCLMQTASVLDGGPGLAGTCCGGSCVDLSSDSQNCVACGSACPAGFTCQRGCKNGAQSFTCNFSPSICPAGTACVVGPFGSNYGCELVSCAGRPDNSPCSFDGADPGACCGGACVYLEYDPRNCGSCGHDCGGSLCQGGTCDSDLPSNDCIPPCGPGEICFVGRCLESVCQATYYPYYVTALVYPYYLPNDLCVAKDAKLGLCCGEGACLDTAADPSNCGGCGFQCDPGKACVDGVCEGAVCGAGTPYGFCDPTNQNKHCCGSQCVDVSNDPANCGYCGNACPPAKSCLAGSCT